MRIQDVSRNKKDEKVEVLGTGPIPDVKLGPVQVIGETPGTTMGDGSNIDNAISREHVDLVDVAPIVGDATARNPARKLPEGKPIRKFRIVSPGGKHVNDPGGGGRIFLHEGKEITTQHYDIRKLQMQGLRVQEVTGISDTEPVQLMED